MVWAEPARLPVVPRGSRHGGKKSPARIKCGRETEAGVSPRGGGGHLLILSRASEPSPNMERAACTSLRWNFQRGP